MAFDPFDSAMRHALEELKLRQRMMDSIPDAVRQAQKDLAAREEIWRHLKNRQDLARQIEERQRILRQFEESQEVLQALEERQHLSQLLEQSGALSDFFLHNRNLIDPYVYDSLYGHASGVPWVGQAYGLASFDEENEALAESYEKVGALLESGGEEQLPQSVQAIPVQEAFTSAEVVAELEVEPESTEAPDEDEVEEREQRRQLRGEIQSEAHRMLVPALEDLDPRLVLMWQGGLEAIAGTNPDRVRHFSASMRELSTHVIHRLAPDDEVRRWNSAPDLYHNGKPTRRARLLYICRWISQPTFQEFITVDYSVVLSTLDLFNKGTHEIQADFTKEQLDALETRAANFLLSLLQLGKQGN